MGASKTYEEANWARLSPTFRAAHNRLREERGLPPIPAPVVDHYVAPEPTGIRELTVDDAKEAMEELGVPHVDDVEAQLWMGIRELRGTIERLKLEERRLALKNAQTQLQDREIKTKTSHATIIDVATMFLTTAPEADRTMPNAREAVLRFFGAKPGIKSGHRVWRGGEVGERTVDYVLKHISVDDILKANEPLVPPLLPPEDIGDGVTERVRPSSPPPSRTPEEQQAWAHKTILEGIKIAEDSGDEVTAKLLRRLLRRALRPAR